MSRPEYRLVDMRSTCGNLPIPLLPGGHMRLVKFVCS